MTTVPIEEVPNTSPVQDNYSKDDVTNTNDDVIKSDVDVTKSDVDVTKTDVDVTKTDDDVTKSDNEKEVPEELIITLGITLSTEPHTADKTFGVITTTVPVVRNQATTIGYRHIVRKLVCASFWYSHIMCDYVTCCVMTSRVV